MIINVMSNCSSYDCNNGGGHPFPPSRLFFCFLILLAIPLSGFGRGSDPQGEDAIAVQDKFYKLIDSTSRTDPELALQYCDSLYFLARSSGTDTAMIDALIYKTRMLRILGNMDSAFSSVNAALRASDSLNDDRRLGEAYYYRGVLSFLTVGPMSAEKDFSRSFGLLSQIADSAGMATALNGIGAAQFQRSNLDSAAIYYLMAIKISEPNEFNDILCKAYTNMGLIFDALGEDDQALTYLSKSAELNERLNNRYYLVVAYNGIANILFKYDQLDTVKTLCDMCLEISAELNNIKGMADAYHGLANVADRRGQISQARELFLDAKRYYELIDDSEGICNALNNVGRIESRMGNYSKARVLLDSAFAIAKEKGFKEKITSIYWNYANLYARSGDFEKAYTYHVQFKNLSDTLYQIDKQKRIAQLKLAYDVEKERAENLELKTAILEQNYVVERRTRQRNSYLFTGLTIILALVFFIAYYSQRMRKNRIIAEQRILQLEEEKKLLAARSIVEGQEEERKRVARELHDGLGVLLSSARMHFTSIRDKTPEAQPLLEKAAKLLEQASGDVRRISHNMMPGLLTKYGVFEAAEELFEQVDEMEGIRAEMTIEGDTKRLPENTEIMLYRIFQEMLNNTLKHAGAQHIMLVLTLASNRLSVVYSDDGKGFDFEEKIKERSLGLTGLKSRVKFLGGELEAQSQPGKGVRYSFTIEV